MRSRAQIVLTRFINIMNEKPCFLHAEMFQNAKHEQLRQTTTSKLKSIIQNQNHVRYKLMQGTLYAGNLYTEILHMELYSSVFIRHSRKSWTRTLSNRRDLEGDMGLMCTCYAHSHNTMTLHYLGNRLCFVTFQTDISIPQTWYPDCFWSKCFVACAASIATNNFNPGRDNVWTNKYQTVPFGACIHNLIFWSNWPENSPDVVVILPLKISSLKQYVLEQINKMSIKQFHLMCTLIIWHLFSFWIWVWLWFLPLTFM